MCRFHDFKHYLGETAESPFKELEMYYFKPKQCCDRPSLTHCGSLDGWRKENYLYLAELNESLLELL